MTKQEGDTQTGIGGKPYDTTSIKKEEGVGVPRLVRTGTMQERPEVGTEVRRDK